MIKLDRELVREVDLDEAKRALVEMLGIFASRVDAWILAEGIERVEELDTLAALGVPLLQGYLLGRPAPPWQEVDLDVALRLSSRPRPVLTHTVRSVLEQATTARSVTEAVTHFDADPQLTDLVLLDGHRPVAVLSEEGQVGELWVTHFDADPQLTDLVLLDGHRPVAVLSEEGARFGMFRPGMVVNLDTRVADVLARSITRERSDRFSPLLVTDNAGRYVGVARMERLIGRIASEEPVPLL